MKAKYKAKQRNKQKQKIQGISYVLNILQNYIYMASSITT